MLNILAFVGASVIAVFLAYLAFVFGRELRHIHRVAKDYHRTAPSPDSWGNSNYFVRIQEGLNKDKERLYLVERKASNTDFSLSLHIKDYKHTKTAKAVKKAKAQKKAVENADLRCSGGDGM